MASPRVIELRTRAAQIIERLRKAAPENRPSLIIELRTVQDWLSVLKQRNPRIAAETCNLAWVDDWRPD